MDLTDPQKTILDGSQGAAVQHALALIVRYAGVLEAEQRCRVTWADSFCGAHHYLDVAASSRPKPGHAVAFRKLGRDPVRHLCALAAGIFTAGRR